MASVSTSTVAANGLPIQRIALPGTRALTVMVAFDAGARGERREENGMAHFLEHLVFKGGQSYPTYKDVNETAERLGGVLNAYTSHDVVAFHITVRAQSAPQAIDLLTARPAKLLGTAAGRLSKGARADLCLFHPVGQRVEHSLGPLRPAVARIGACPGKRHRMMIA